MGGPHSCFPLGPRGSVSVARSLRGAQAGRGEDQEATGPGTAPKNSTIIAHPRGCFPQKNKQNKNKRAGTGLPFEDWVPSWRT